MVSCFSYSVYAHLKSPVPKPTYQGLTGAGGIVPISSVPKLDTYITHDQPITMIQGRSGFFALTLYNAKADSVIWQVDVHEHRNSDNYAITRLLQVVHV